MKLLRLIIIVMMAVIALPSGELAAARRKKPAKTEKAQVKKSSNKKSKTKATKQEKASKKKSTKKSKRSSKKEQVKASRSGRLKSLRRNRSSNRARVVMTDIDTQEPLSDTRRRDNANLRLRNGGDYKLPSMGLAVERIANLEPITTRFRRGDTTLTKKNIETLYFTREGKSDDVGFFGQIVPKVDDAIKSSNYKEAYVLAQKGLWRNPMHVGLIKRACELSEHEKDIKRNDIYIWQISELFHLIQNTGDGKTAKTAMRVVYQEDAYFYELLWLETPAERIVNKKVVAYQGCELLTYSIKDDKGDIQSRYYLVGK